jgi:signal transduction histidine kinase
VQELVKLHGGFIRVESVWGKGSTFVVSIPFVQNHLASGQLGGARSLTSAAVGATPFVEEALRWLPDSSNDGDEILNHEFLPVPCPPTSGTGVRPRILIADDNIDMRQYLARLLAEHYDIETVPDGQAALEAARERPPHLILSDVMMPVRDGFQLLEAIRKDERTRTIPFVLLSARAGEESRVEGMHAGADDYLIKPFSARELLARVSARLEIARLQGEGERRYRELAESLEILVRARTEQLEQRTAELVKQSEDTRSLSAQLLQIQSEERRRIARELHDSAGQTLAVLGMNLGHLINVVKTKAPEIAGQAETSDELVRQLQQEIRTASYLLHPPLLDETGLTSALGWYTQGLKERTDLNIALDIPEDFGRVQRDIELVVFRLVQECLTNIHRHSGSKTAIIRLTREADMVVLEVRDEGKGISRERLAEIQSGGSGVGIRGMRERVAHFSGTMRIDSNGSGTRIYVAIPMSEAALRDETGTDEPLQTVV